MKKSTSKTKNSNKWKIRNKESWSMAIKRDRNLREQFANFVPNSSISTPSYPGQKWAIVFVVKHRAGGEVGKGDYCIEEQHI